MRSEYDCCERVHAHGELSCCTDQIVRAIREHTRAMVAAQRWTLLCSQYPNSREDVLGERAIIETDDLLAALAASSGGENDAASGATGAGTALAQGAEVAAESPSGVRKTEPKAQAATPPLSADFVTVRRDDLAWAMTAAMLDHPELMNDERAVRLNKAVSR